MSETLWGVLIGGVIGWIVPIAHSITEFRKWKRERRYAVLKEKRDRREKLYDDLIEKIAQGMQEKSYDITMIASILKLCPGSVTKAFDAMMLEKNGDESKKKSRYLDLCVALKADIAEIEHEMETIF
jgi:hypothetical protein